MKRVFQKSLSLILLSSILFGFGILSGCSSTSGEKKESPFSFPSKKNETKSALKKTKKDPDVPVTIGEWMSQERNDSW